MCVVLLPGDYYRQTNITFFRSKYYFINIRIDRINKLFPTPHHDFRLHT